MFPELTLTAKPLPLSLPSSPLLDAVADLAVLDDAVATAFEASLRRACAEIDRDMREDAA